MPAGIVVAIEFGPEHIAAHARIGAQPGPQWCWEAPARASAEAPFWLTEDGQALVLEVLALMHFPNIDVLVLALPAHDVAACAALLEARYAGSHDLRNTECRSQRLAVQVRRVQVVPLPLDDDHAAAALSS